MNETAGKILIEGNAAAAIGCMMAGVTVVAWYPITPSSSLCESLIGYMKKYRVDKDDREGDVRDRAGGGRDRVARHGDRRELGGRAVDDGDGRPRHLADARVRRPGVLRRNAGGDLRRAARRAVHRPADAHRAGRPAVGRVPLARRHQAHHAHSRRSVEECYTMAHGGVRPRRAVPDAGVRDDGPRPRHEQLDVRRRSSIPTKPINRGKLLDAGEARRSSASGAATRTWTATASRTARFRATACRRTSRAAPATTRRGSTASGPTTTSTTWIGWRASSRRRASSCRSRWSTRSPRREDRLHRLRHVALGDRREPRSAARGDRRQDVVLPAARLSVHRRARRRSSTRTSASTSIEQNRDAQMLQLMKLELTPERVSRSCAASCTTTACRSTPAASPTTCWRRKGSKWRRRRPRRRRRGVGMTGGE